MNASGIGRRVEHCMGTVFSIDIRCDTVTSAAVDEVVRWLHWVDATFSTYQAGSQVSRLARDEVALDECAPEIAEVLLRCADLESTTDGYFSAYAGGVLEPSGLVKGWAIERASDLLEAAGSTAHCVNGGGDVQCVGLPSTGRTWQIGIAHPLQPGLLAGIVTGAGSGTTIAVATSGSAERGSHILDPHTARAATYFASVSIVGPSVSVADAYATAAFAMGADAHGWISELADYQGFTIRTDGQQWSNLAPRE
jgi:thiamine biosynthesis lipoprotein